MTVHLKKALVLLDDNTLIRWDTVLWANVTEKRIWYQINGVHENRNYTNDIDLNKVAHFTWESDGFHVVFNSYAVALITLEADCVNVRFLHSNIVFSAAMSQKAMESMKTMIKNLQNELLLY